MHTEVAALANSVRDAVLDIAKAQGIPAVETKMGLHDLYNADEVFLTGSAAEVTPVGSIGDWTFEVGKITQTLMEDYSNFVRGKHKI